MIIVVYKKGVEYWRGNAKNIHEIDSDRAKSLAESVLEQQSLIASVGEWRVSCEMAD